ncbi:hypothetical protein A2U01_0052096, partial [Trifolium medium]|nr:hypothetical protein [Trifolium medium]
FHISSRKKNADKGKILRNVPSFFLLSSKNNRRLATRASTSNSICHHTILDGRTQT